MTTTSSRIIYNGNGSKILEIMSKSDARYVFEQISKWKVYKICTNEQHIYCKIDSCVHCYYIESINNTFIRIRN